MSAWRRDGAATGFGAKSYAWLRVMVSTLLVIGATGTISATAACGSTRTVFKTEPPGADVYFNGRLLGQSPVTHTVRRDSMGHRFHLELVKAGYAPLDFYLDAKQNVGVALCAMFLFPCEFSTDLEPSYAFNLLKE